MELRDKVTVVTGGASGIGRALAHKFAAEGARAVVVADVDARGADAVAAELTQGGAPAEAVATDVAVEADIIGLIDTTVDRHGPIDLFCSNAGIGVSGGPEAPDDGWQRIWDINLMAHVWAARRLLPEMLARGEGYFLQTASAAGLLTQIGSAPYSVTKHAAVAFAEWLSITYGERGIKVSCLCPQGVRTNMLREGGGFLAAGALEPEVVADCVVAGLREERFLILPHPEVAEYFRRRGDDHERWLAGMRRMQARVTGRTGRPA